MNSLLRQLSAWVVLTMLAGACSKSPSPAQQASELEAVFQKVAATQPASNRDAVEQALAAVRSKDYVGAVLRLEAAKRNSELSGDQRMELEQLRRAVSRVLTDRALQGDQGAVADLQAIEKAMNPTR